MTEQHPHAPPAPPALTPQQHAALAGAVWLNSGVTRPPTENDLADVAERLCVPPDSLALVKACVPVSEAVAWIVAARSKRRG
ncbi:MAG: hypothetical protein WC565_05100 [Parcubacteria group bacterium]